MTSLPTPDCPVISTVVSTLATLVLAEGRVLAEGTPGEIAASEDVQAAYLGKSK
jgi:ABC-type branched-subunit amino acid transport system ATPase component